MNLQTLPIELTRDTNSTALIGEYIQGIHDKQLRHYCKKYIPIVDISDIVIFFELEIIEAKLIKIGRPMLYTIYLYSYISS